ncbi:uncharacterized protein PRCAT00000729001 [Priceomyces carsonii]|uniref:uncharacterized protein n=1 Tax=Priceomyces carsonii TaxID=28549 RepID=UPI002ED83106|nr:unnamed protein product [Priceomyces carsonii]
MSVQRPLWVSWARVFLTGAGIIGTGVVLYKYTVPTDDQLIASFSPEIRAEYERDREFRQKEQQAVMDNARETAASDNPIWMAGKIKSPFDKDTRGMDPQLVDYELFRKLKNDDFKQEQIKRAQEDLAETEKLSSKKRSWWSWK